LARVSSRAWSRKSCQGSRLLNIDESRERGFSHSAILRERGSINASADSPPAAGILEAGILEQGCSLISEGLAALDALGAILGEYFYLVLLANGQLRSGRIDDGLDTLDRAEALIRKTGSQWCEAEVHRLRGDLQLARSAKADAETSYQKAIEMSRSQDAKLWEIRASTSLGCLWRDQGKRHEARDLLARVYNWFTEGFDTPDLMNAKALLNELQ
jgi:predicted ATPase